MKSIAKIWKERGEIFDKLFGINDVKKFEIFIQKIIKE